VRGVGRHNGRAAGQVHVDPTGVFLGGILQTKFLADLFDARLDLLDVAGGVVAPADDPGWVLEDGRPMRTAEDPDPRMDVGRWVKRTHEDDSVHAPWRI
jgi:hypothetical protein